ncbi:hypothetical protein BJ165DRAFT_1528546 [Panaeolus papilionaceus]|nr:hypothetical protein BJ165DRAFT_1528546 [Panaeolus papilionaceus]
MEQQQTRQPLEHDVALQSTAAFSGTNYALSATSDDSLATSVSSRNSSAASLIYGIGEEEIPGHARECLAYAASLNLEPAIASSRLMDITVSGRSIIDGLEKYGCTGERSSLHTILHLAWFVLATSNYLEGLGTSVVPEDSRSKKKQKKAVVDKRRKEIEDLVDIAASRLETTLDILRDPKNGSSSKRKKILADHLTGIGHISILCGHLAPLVNKDSLRLSIFGNDIVRAMYEDITENLCILPDSKPEDGVAALRDHLSEQHTELQTTLQSLQEFVKNIPLHSPGNITVTRNSSQSSFAPASNQSSPVQARENLFGELASTYGFNSGVPSIPSRSSSPSPKSSRCGASHHQSPAASTAVAVPSPPAPPKNYEQSYGNLVATTAFGAGVPSLNLPSSQKKKATSESRTATSTPLTLSRVPSSSHSSLSHKGYERGFGQLAKTYEFGTHLSVPSLSRV